MVIVGNIGNIGNVGNVGNAGTIGYRIFPLLSACAYVSTGRKPALNNDVRLTARCA
jgi:hypothetical protein